MRYNCPDKKQKQTMRILDPKVKYMFPDEGLMAQWFDEFNRRFFDGELEPIELRAVYSRKRNLGFFSAPRRDRCPGYHPERCLIGLNSRFFDKEEEWRNTILHEMVHYAVYKQTDGEQRGHGAEFKRIAARINNSSEFKIETYSPGRSFRPQRKEVENWEKRRCREFIVGSAFSLWIEDFEDEDEVIQIKRRNPIATFKTTKAYAREVIDNLREDWVEINWFEVTACRQQLALVKGVSYTPDYHEEYSFRNDWYEEDIKKGKMTGGPREEFGPIECRFLGTTEIKDGAISGFGAGPLKSTFRCKYFRDADWIGEWAAEKLIAIYEETPQWYRTTHHGMYRTKSPGGDYSVELDSRFVAMVAMTPQRIQINPVRSEEMMELIRNGDKDSLRQEITKKIKLHENKC